MEKYYLSNLTNLSDSSVDLKRGPKLVEIHYARRPPSFGLVYFCQEQGAKAKPAASIQLATLELSDNNVAKFATTIKVEFGTKQLGSDCLVGFDVSKTIMMEEGGSHKTGRGRPVNCIALTQRGTIFSVELKDGSVDSPTSGHDWLQSRLNDGRFIQCQLQQRQTCQLLQPESHPSDCYVHLLAEKTYSLNRLHKCELQPIHKYSIMPSEWSLRQFKSLLQMETNVHVVIVELDDSSLRILQHSNCLATLNQTDLLGPNQRHLISAANSSDDAILLSYGRSHIVAHSLLVNEPANNCPQTLGDIKRDPDKLLPREPSFELDKCWSLDLNDIDSIRCLDEEDEESERETPKGSLCLMWSTSQLDPGDTMAKFLVVAHKFHLLVYSFEQRPSLPFSVVYDKSFLKVQPLDGNPNAMFRGVNQSIVASEYLDPRLRPRLVHNLKLIGASPSDALFNGIFLAPGAHLMLTNHFAQLGLLIGITSSSDLIAFKCVSSLVFVQRDSLYQQLVAESIRGSSLLANQIELMQYSNHTLQQDIANLESRSKTGKQSEQQLDKFLKTDLRARDDIGCLYNLSMSLSNLIQVNRIVILSTAGSFFLKPTSSLIKSAHIDNEFITREDNLGQILIANSISQTTFGAQGLNGGFVHNCAILELWRRKQTQQTSIELPIFIGFGQSGHIEVHFELDSSQPESISSHLISSGEVQANNNYGWSSGETAARTHTITLPIKVLMSYQPTELATISDDSTSMICQFTGRFRSVFTHCSIDYDLKDNQATITSDDLIAIEFIKRQILKQATNNFIELEISHSTPTTRHLRYLIGLQHKNLSIASKLSNMSDLADSQSSEFGGELLLESLMSEINFCKFPAKFVTATDCLVESIRKDIKSLKLSKNGDRVMQPLASGRTNEPSAMNIFNYLICKFIIDALVDFDKLHGSRPASEMVVSMRVKLSDTLRDVAELDESSFSSSTLDQWMEIKTKGSIKHVK